MSPVFLADLWNGLAYPCREIDDLSGESRNGADMNQFADDVLGPVSWTAVTIFGRILTFLS